MIENIEKSGFDLTNSLNKDYLKENGITFTPFSIIEHMYDILNKENIDYLNIKILEPSVGSGNFYIFLINKLLQEGIVNSSNIENFLNNLYGYEIEEKFLNLFKYNIKDLIISYLEEINFDIDTILKNNFKLGNFLTENIQTKFDLILGNPPYVRTHNLNKETKESLKKFKEIYHGNADLSLYFIYKSINLLSEKGYSLFITSNKFSTAKYGYLFRLFSYKYLFYYEDNYKNPFEKVQIETAIIGFNKNKGFSLNKNFLNGEEWNFKDSLQIQKKEYTLKDLDVNISNGLVSGCNEAHIISKEVYEEWILKDSTLIDFLKPILNGKDLNLEKNNYKVNKYIIYATKENSSFIYKNNILMTHLLKFKDKLENRSWYKKQKDLPYFILQSVSQKKIGEFNYLTKRIGELKFVKVPSNIYYMDTIYNLIYDKDTVNIKNLLIFLEKEKTLKEFNCISNKIGSKFEIHSNKFSRIGVSEEEKDFLNVK